MGGRVYLLTKTSALLWIPGNSARQSLRPSEEEETDSRSKCSERTKKCIRGVLLTILIAFSWAGTLHLLKLTFHWNQRAHNSPVKGLSSPDPTIHPTLSSASPVASSLSPELFSLSSSPATIDPPNFAAESEDASHSDDVDGEEPFNVSRVSGWDRNVCSSSSHCHRTRCQPPVERDACKASDSHVSCPLVTSCRETRLSVSHSAQCRLREKKGMTRERELCVYFWAQEMRMM